MLIDLGKDAVRYPKASEKKLWREDGEDGFVHVHDFISSETLFSGLYCTAANPVNREEEHCPQ